MAMSDVTFHPMSVLYQRRGKVCVINIHRIVYYEYAIMHISRSVDVSNDAFLLMSISKRLITNSNSRK